MKISKSYIAFIILIFSSLSAKATNDVNIGFGDYFKRNIQSDFRGFEDTVGLDIATIRTLNDSVFINQKNKHITNTSSVYWLKFSLINPSQKPQRRVINFNDPDFKVIELYDEDVVYKSGSAVPFSDRPITHKNFVFEIDFEGAELKTVYVKLQSDYHSSFVADLGTTSALMSYSLTEYYILGLFYGVILILAVYNLILYTSEANKSYLYYVFYILSCALFALDEDGLGFQFLWSNAPAINQVIRFVAPITLLVSYMIYATSYIGLKSQRRFFYYLSWFVAVVFLFYYGFSHLISNNYQWGKVYFIPYLVMFYAVFKVQNGYQNQLYFTIGNAIITLSIIVYALRQIGVIPSGILPVYSFNIAFIIEAVVLSIAVGQQVKSHIKRREVAQNAVIQGLRENEMLKDKVNRELEEKVAQRTTELKSRTDELNHKNAELVDLQRKLYEMNEQLDKKNFELQRNIKVKNLDVLNSKELTLDVFRELFPSRKHCLEFVANIKYVGDYKCHKCRSTDFKSVDDLARVCKNCNTKESVTAHTILHAVKFDLTVALYLAYIFSLKNNSKTLDELHAEVSVSRNSIFNFKKKIKARIEELEQNGVHDIDLKKVLV